MIINNWNLNIYVKKMHKILIFSSNFVYYYLIITILNQYKYYYILHCNEIV